MKQTIKFLRKEAPYASKAAAITGLNSVSHVCGQPVVAFYKYTPTGGSEETRVALAIGLSTGTGATNYRLVADDAELSEYESLLGSYATQLSNHIGTLANGSTAGHVKDGGDLTFTDGIGTFKDIAPNTILGNKASSSARPTALTATEVRTILNVANGAEVNQNAFSNVKVGSTTVAADAKQDTLELVAGNQITLTPDADNDKVTINLKTNPSLGAATATTAAAGTNTTQVATTAFVKTAVDNGIATADAMIYKGTIAGGSTGTYGALTSAASKGWTYKVTTAGKIDGVAVEVGDMIICNTDTAAASSSDYGTVVNNWDFIQANIDGYVIGPASSTSGDIAIFNGTTGKVIQDSNIAASDVVSLLTGAVRTSRKVDTTGVLEGGGNLSADRTISHKTLTTAYSEGSGAFITSLTVDDYGHVSAATKGGITASNSGSGSFVTGVTASGNTITVTKGNVPAESGKVKVDASDGAGYLANKVVTGTANLTGNNNTYAVTAATAGSGTSKTVALTCTIDTIDGGEF